MNEIFQTVKMKMWNFK